jgi:hypothetical protein
MVATGSYFVNAGEPPRCRDIYLPASPKHFLNLSRKSA